MTTMTKADRHRESAQAALQDFGPCPHGNAQGSSNYDVAYCGACESELADEYQEVLYEEELNEAIAEGRYLHPAGPRYVPPLSATTDDAPF